MLEFKNKLNSILKNSPEISDKTKQRIIDLLQAHTAEALEKSELKYKLLSAELETIIDHFPGMFFYKDTENNYIRVNEYMANCYGKSKDDFVGKNMLDIYPEEEAQRYHDKDMEVLKTEKPIFNYYEQWTVNEEKRWVSKSKMPYYDYNGKLQGVIGYAIDVTKKQEYELELQSRNIRLEAHNQLRYAILNCASEKELMAAAAGILIRVLGFKAITIGYAGDKESRFVEISEYDSEGLRSSFKPEGPWKDNKACVEPVLICMNSATPLHIIAGDKEFEAINTKANEYGIVAVNFEPLKTNTDVYGVIGFYLSNAEQDDSEQEFLTIFTSELASGLLNLRFRKFQVQSQLELKESEERLKAAQKIAKIGTWEVDLLTDTIIWSDFVYQLLDFDRNTSLLSRQGFFECVHKSDLKRLKESNIEALNNPNEDFFVEYRIQNKQGTELWVEQTARVYTNELGELVKMIGVLHNITERRKREQDLSMLSAVVEQSPLYVVITNKKGYIEYVNPAFTQITGYTIEDVKGKNPGILKSGKVPKRVYVDLWRTIKSGSTWRGEFINKKKNGEEYHERVIVAPVITESNEIIHFFAIKEDRTKQMKAEHKLLESEAKLKEAQRISSLGNWELDIAKGEMYWSDEMFRILGFMSGEVKPSIKLFLETVHPNDYKKVVKTHTESIKNKQAYELGHRLVLKNNELKYVTQKCTTHYNDHGEALRTVGIVVDVTDQKKAKIKEVENIEKLNFLFDRMIQGVVYQNEEGEIISANKAAGRILGLTMEQMQGRKSIDPSWRSIRMDGSDFPGNEHPAIVSLRTGKPVMNEKMGVYNPKTKSNTWININSVPEIRENEDKPFQVFTTFEDITDIIEASKKLKRAKQIAESANKTKSDFIANMSHEIRTPMNAILGFSEILQEKFAEKPQYTSYFEGIRSSGKNLLLLINDILDLSKIESNRVQLKLVSVDLKALIKEIKQIFLVKYTEKNLGFEYFIPLDFPSIIEIDEIRFRQILFNLIGNAIKFTDNGTIEIRIDTVEKKADVLNFRLRVIDSGMGIKPDSQSAIFEPFRQQENQDIEKYGGTGLGLAITKRLAETMGGKISLKSKEGIGSEFIIYFENVKYFASINTKEDTTEVRASSLVFDKATVCITDDLATMRFLVVEFLNNTGFVVVEAESGYEAISKVKNQKIDLLLLDINMPLMDGNETARRIKEIKPDLPIIAYTAAKTAITDVSLFAGVLEKPLSQQTLLIKLSEYLSHHVADETETKAIKKVDFNINTTSTELADMAHILKEEKEHVLKFLSMPDVIIFANKLLEFSGKAESESLKESGNKLYLFAENFDVERIEEEFRFLDKVLS